MAPMADALVVSRRGDARSPWVKGPAWDALWLQSALWLAPLALLLAHGYDDPDDSPLDAMVFGLTALFWIGHRIGSSWLAYATTAYRPLVRDEPVRFVVVPIETLISLRRSLPIILTPEFTNTGHLHSPM